MLLACDPMDKDEPQTANKTEKVEDKGDEKDKPLTPDKTEKDDGKRKDKPSTPDRTEKGADKEKDEPSTADKTEKDDGKESDKDKDAPLAGDTTPITAASSHPIAVDDTNDNNAIEAGETITLAFSEAVKIANPTANIKVGTTAGKTDKTFGTDAAIVAVTPEDGFAAQWQITLGTSPDVAAGHVIWIAKEHVADKAGNNPAQNIVFTVPKWPQKLTTTTSPSSDTVKLGGKGKDTITLTSESDKTASGASGAWSYTQVGGTATAIIKAKGQVTGTSAGTIIVEVARAADAKYAAAFTEVTVALEHIEFGGVVWVSRHSNSNWKSANTYCNGLDKYGKDDWRLPSRAELTALWNANRYRYSSGLLIGNGIDKEFGWAHNQYYWTSTEFSTDTELSTGRYWTSSFVIGQTTGTDLMLFVLPRLEVY